MARELLEYMKQKQLKTHDTLAKTNVNAGHSVDPGHMGSWDVVIILP